MKRKLQSRKDALAMREVYPPEEFAGFENFGEFPEWQPGQAEERKKNGKDVPAPDFYAFGALPEERR